MSRVPRMPTSQAQLGLFTPRPKVHACRAGTQTRYWFGDDGRALPQHAWTRSNCGLRTQPVGKLTANPFGLHDVHRNLAEWCQDWRGPYPGADLVTDPVGPGEGFGRVLRGGDWVEMNGVCYRSAFRHCIDPIRRRNYGLRVARTWLRQEKEPPK